MLVADFRQDILFTAIMKANATYHGSALMLCLALLLTGCQHSAPSATAPADADSSGQAVVVHVQGQATATPQAETPPAAPASLPPLELLPDDWTSLFDGQSLYGWKAADFAGAGEVRADQDRIIIEAGALLSGVILTNEPPRIDYEIELEAMKLSGSDFFCGLTLPYAQTNFTLIVGGWGGGVIGISSIDGNDASSNDTTQFRNFESNRWYPIRVRVTKPRIEVWLEGRQVINADVREHTVGMRPGEIELAVPLSVSTYQTSAALRNVRLRAAKPGN